MIHTDAFMVRRIEVHLAADPTDHMLGCQVRLLFQQRGEELRQAGVIELPDDPYDPRD